MQDDFETFSKKNRKRRGDDFITMFSDLFSKMNLKVAAFLFILGVLLFSDSFVDMFLIDMEGATDSTDCPTSKGTVIQLLLLTLGYIIIDLLAKGEII